MRIDTIDANTPHTDITYRAVLTDPSDITGAVVNILRFEEARTAIIFCHTREAVRQLHTTLAERGFSSVAISGDLGQNERIRAIESLRHGQARVCVATDVAARGIDIPELGLVIHASLPSCPETLLHRSGRTGRAGRKGTCVLLVPPARRRAAERGSGAMGGRHADCYRLLFSLTSRIQIIIPLYRNWRIVSLQHIRHNKSLMP